MHFTIGSASGAKDSSSLFDMSHELSMLKAALLYGDEIKLCSVGASIISGFVEFHELTNTQLVPLVKKFGWTGLTPEQQRKFDLVYGIGGTRAERCALGRRKKAKVVKSWRP